MKVTARGCSPLGRRCTATHMMATHSAPPSPISKNLQVSRSAASTATRAIAATTIRTGSRSGSAAGSGVSPRQPAAGLRGAACSGHRRGVLCARPLEHPGPIAAVVAADRRQSAIDRGHRDPKKTSDDLLVPRDCKSRRAARLWAGHPGFFFRQVGAMARKVLQGAKVAELPAEWPNAIPTGGEFEDREADRYHAAGVDSAARRRGDRIVVLFAAAHSVAIGTERRFQHVRFYVGCLG